MNELEVARRQLGMALHLYIENLDPVSIHSLAGNAREIIDRIAADAGVQGFRDHVLVTFPGWDEKRYYRTANVYRSAFKHMNKAGDRDLANIFNDEDNRHLLFVCWYTYGNLSKSLPIEAQCFQAWYFAQDPERSADEEFADRVLDFFGNMSNLNAVQRKTLLKAAIKNARSDSNIMDDLRTEKIPLIFTNSDR